MVLIVFGWPSAVVGLFLLIWGGLSGRFLLSVAGLVASLGFCVYVTMQPAPVGWFGLAALVTNGASTAAVRRHSRTLATLCVLPFLSLAVYVAFLVLAR